MKVAILLYGQMRNLNISIKSWDFMNHWDCDFYVSSWTKTTQYDKNLTAITQHEIIDYDYIKKYLKNSVIDLLDETEINEKYKLNNINAKKMMFHIKNAYDKMIMTKKKYDFIFLIRSDLYFRFHISLQDFFKFKEENTIYCLNELEFFYGNPWANDLYFWGNFDTISKFINSIDFNTNLGPHNYFGRLFIDLNIKIKNEQFLDVVIIRPNSLTLKDNEINFENILKNTLSW